MSQPIDITVDRVIRLTTDQLEPEVVGDIQQVMTIPNREKVIAKKQHLWGADRLEDWTTLYSWSDQRLILPRGFYLRLVQGLKHLDYELNITNNVSRNTYDKNWGKALEQFSPNLRDYQEKAVDDLLYYCQGIYQAPTGSGKTVTILEVIRRASERTLVIVNKKEIVQQWIDRSKEHLNFEPGFIGDGKWDKPNLRADGTWEESQFTVAMQQTLWARRDEIEPEWWAQWGMVILDECHSVQAETYDQIMQRFSAMYRIGVSATPKKTGDFKICEAVLGPIIHATPRKPLVEAGYLIQPEVFTIPTDFYYAYRPNEIAENKAGRKYVKKQNNWHDLVKALITDVPRNTLIANTAKNLDKRTILILSKRLEHLEQLRQLLSDKREVLLLTGAESLDERMQVYERVSQGNCIILSTLANEAVDMPRIDTLFLVFPTKNTDLIRQQIGRGSRPHPKKKDFLIYDFVDFAIQPIKTQYRDRRNFVYRPEEISVTKVLK